MYAAASEARNAMSWATPCGTLLAGRGAEAV